MAPVVDQEPAPSWPEVIKDVPVTCQDRLLVRDDRGVIEVLDTGITNPSTDQLHRLAEKALRQRGSTGPVRPFGLGMLGAPGTDLHVYHLPAAAGRLTMEVLPAGRLPSHRILFAPDTITRNVYVHGVGIADPDLEWAGVNDRGEELRSWNRGDRDRALHWLGFRPEVRR
ncbi:hypothetical protein LG293_17910 (plasmid) [Citricoccus nitrophenolicus]